MNTKNLPENSKILNMKVTVIPVVIGALATVTKGLGQCQKYLDIRGRMETTQTTALEEKDTTEYEEESSQMRKQ